jgi:alpha-L-rhamnosidase
MLCVAEVSCNYKQGTIGTVQIPQIGWIIESDKKNVRQKSYQIQVAGDEDFNEILYDSKEVFSDQSNHVLLPELKLSSCTRYYYRVRLSDCDGERSEFSKTDFFETAFLKEDDWKAKFITADTAEDAQLSDARLFRTTFEIQKPIKSARAYVTALGLYEFYLNGKKVTDAVLTPGWTEYNSRVLYQTYDVTELIKTGENVAGAHVGAGWYKGSMGYIRIRNIYGDRTAFLCQIQIEYEDGTKDMVLSDEAWKWSKGPVLFSEIYDGETYDARLEKTGYSESGYDDTDWKPVEVMNHNKNVLKAQDGEYVKIIETIKPKRLFTTPKGEKVIDFGQNMSGWVKFRVRGKAGERAVIKHFEVLDAEGNVYTENLRTAKSRIEYICRGEKEEIFEPHFTFQGFQYIYIEEFPGEVKKEDFIAEVIHSDMKETGYFECSNPLINQLWHNIKWGLKGNFVDIPTDCPQRDERLGWTGDAQIFVRTASYIMNTYTFFRKWLRDVEAAQFDSGSVPYVIPDILEGLELRLGISGELLDTDGAAGSTAWGDVAVIAPWTMYLTYGDTEILKNQYKSMTEWIRFMDESAGEGHIFGHRFHFGDWVALDAEEGSYLGATPNELTGTAYFAYSTNIVAKTARILGYEADVKKYEALYRDIVSVFRKEFFTASGEMTVRTQTAHILALYFNLVPERFRSQTVKTLLELLKERDGHLVTGFVGTPYFCHALSQNGCSKEAYELLLKEDFPSWLYQVKMGATTIWEHWDGLKPDGSMWSPDMNSFNHYAYGAIGEWMYRAIAGLEADEDQAGYKHTIIYPHIGGGFSYAEGGFQSVYGLVKSRWENQNGEITLRITVPHNTTATVVLENAVNIQAEMEFKKEDGIYRAKTGSGEYVIKYCLREA